VDLAAFGHDPVLVGLKLFDGVHVKSDGFLEQARLVAIKLVRRHLSKCDIQQSGLVHVLVGGRQHGDPDLAGANLGRQPPCQVVGYDGAAHAATDD